MTQDKNGPRITPVNPIAEQAARTIGGAGRAGAIGQWLSRAYGSRQLQGLGTTADKIPWTPLRRPVAQTTVALITTSGVHVRTDQPFDQNSDASYRVIPGDAEPEDLQITHRGYDRRDAARDMNLVFPLPRLRELADEGVVGRIADEHFGFGLNVKLADLQEPGMEVGARLAGAGVDLALLVPA